MVLLIETGDPNTFEMRPDPEMPSWTDPVEPYFISAREAAYIDLIQSAWKVKDAAGDWIEFKMVFYQALFHLDDVVLKQDKALIRAVKKSRNTSFTVDTIISNAMAQSEFGNLVEPYIKLNLTEAIDLLDQAKDIFKNMTPVVIEEPDESRRISPDVPPPMKKIYVPFNPKDLNLNNAASIRFPNGCKWRAFPASADSSENVRGHRLRGSGGMIDEANYMRYFNNIVIALSDASAGSYTDKTSGEKKNIFQFTVGSTLKGETPFSEWLEKVEKSGSKSIKIYDWPVFRRDKFDKYMIGKCDIPFHENDELVSIVPWHDKKKLWDIWLLDKHRFLEEYMGVKVESEEQFYPTGLVLSAHELEESLPLEELSIWLIKYKDIRIGIDPSGGGGGDYFSITVFGLDYENHWEQLFIFKDKKTELHVMQNFCDTLLGIIHEALIDTKTYWLCTIDATPIGLQLTQFLRKKYGQKHVRGVTGNKRIKDLDGNTLKLNEHGHTNLKKKMHEKKIHLIIDEIQIKHFTVWDYNFKAASSNMGHGDCVMSIIYALLPRETDYTENAPLIHNVKTSPNKHLDDRIMRQFKKRLKNNRIKR